MIIHKTLIKSQMCFSERLGYSRYLNVCFMKKQVGYTATSQFERFDLRCIKCMYRASTCVLGYNISQIDLVSLTQEI